MPRNVLGIFYFITGATFCLDKLRRIWYNRAGGEKNGNRLERRRYYSGISPSGRGWPDGHRPRPLLPTGNSRANYPLGNLFFGPHIKISYKELGLSKKNKT